LKRYGAKTEGSGRQEHSEGTKFLEENKRRRRKNDGQRSAIQVVKEGTGAQPKPNDTVTVNYRGTLISGTGSTAHINAENLQHFPSMA